MSRVGLLFPTHAQSNFLCMFLSALCQLGLPHIALCTPKSRGANSSRPTGLLQGPTPTGPVQAQQIKNNSNISNCRQKPDPIQCAIKAFNFNARRNKYKGQQGNERKQTLLSRKAWISCKQYALPNQSNPQAIQERGRSRLSSVM